jgi:hypothetical protein
MSVHTYSCILLLILVSTIILFVCIRLTIALYLRVEDKYRFWAFNNTEDDKFIKYVHKRICNSKEMLETYRPLAAMMTLHLSRLDEIQDDIEMYDDMLEEMWKQLGNQMESNAPSLQKLRDYYNKLDRIDVYNTTSRNIEMKHLAAKLIRHYEGLENQLQIAGLNPDELMKDDSVKKIISKLQELGIPEKLKNLQCTDEEKKGMTAIMNAMLKKELKPKDLQMLLETPLQKDYLTLLRQFVQRTLVDELLREQGKVQPSHHWIMLPSSMSIRLAMIDQMNQELAEVHTLLREFRAKKDVFRV